MKTSYYLATAVGLTAAAVAVYARFPDALKSREVPSLPVPAETAQAGPTGLPPLPTLPDVTTHPDSARVIPAAGPPIRIPAIPDQAGPTALPAIPPLPGPAESAAPPLALPPMQLAPPPAPTVPPPLPQATPTLPLPTAPTVPSPGLPGIPPVTTAPPIVPVIPVVPVPPPLPSVGLPALPPTSPVTPPVAPLPSPVLPTAPTAPIPLTPNSDSPPTTGNPPPVALASTGKFIVIKGNKLVEGIATVAGDRVIVHQGAIDRPFPKGDVQFVGQTRDDVYRFMLTRVSATDPTARLHVARWCMFSGLREQALAEAREILKIEPGHRGATDLARSLEESLRQFPPDGQIPASKPSKPRGGTLVSEPDLEITPEGATTFATRVQPILSNLCVECHARPDHAGTFKLTRVDGFAAGPQATQTNLRATAGQLQRSNPLNSPLLTKAVIAHGGMKQPAFVTREAAGYRLLEAWVILAIGTPVPSAPGGDPVLPPMMPPVQPPTPPALNPGSLQPPVPPMMPPPQPATPPVLPPVAPIPIIPSIGASPVPPPVASVPPVIVVPPVLPTPPVIPSTTPSMPPIIPPTDSGPKTPPVPVIPIPPAVSRPPLPGGVQPASGPGTGSQFGTGAPPKAPTTGPTSGDEFDPATFNQGMPGK